MIARLRMFTAAIMTKTFSLIQQRSLGHTGPNLLILHESNPGSHRYEYFLFSRGGNIGDFGGKLRRAVERKLHARVTRPLKRVKILCCLFAKLGKRGVGVPPTSLRQKAHCASLDPG